MPMNSAQLCLKRTVITLLLATPLAAQADPTVYLQGGLGLDKQEGLGFFGQRTLGAFALGVEHGGLYMEYRHESNVQTADEHGGDDAIWVGFRTEWSL